MIWTFLPTNSAKKCNKKTGAFVTPGDCFEVPHSMRIGYAYGKQDLIDGLKAISEYIAMKTR